MKDTTNREQVLKKIRRALVHKTKDPFSSVDYESNVYSAFNDIPEIEFAQRLHDNGGKFIFCETGNDVIESLHYLMQENNWTRFFCNDKKIEALLSGNTINHTDDFSAVQNDLLPSITTCEYLVTRTGSAMVSSKQLKGRSPVVSSSAHIIIAHVSQLVNELKDALKDIKIKYGVQLPSAITLISGPSKTADIESTVILGAQGPGDFYVFLLEEEL